MIIHSNFHDYYDGVSKQGIDTGLQYIRKKQIVNERCDWNRGGIPCGSNLIYIGFCGKIYHILQYIKSSSVSYLCYTFEDYQSILSNDTERIKNNYKRYWWSKNNYARELAQVKNFYKNNIINDDRLFLKYQVPIFTYINNQFELNSCLKNLEFYRLFDTWRTYQEISMFLGGMASPEKPIPHIDDKIMVEVKGFDKYSFRKDKQKKNNA